MENVIVNKEKFLEELKDSKEEKISYIEIKDADAEIILSILKQNNINAEVIPTENVMLYELAKRYAYDLATTNERCKKMVDNKDKINFAEFFNGMMNSLHIELFDNKRVNYETCFKTGMEFSNFDLNFEKAKALRDSGNIDELIKMIGTKYINADKLVEMSKEE